MKNSEYQNSEFKIESLRSFFSIFKVPCEDIRIRFPIPEAWIYIFREERAWGVGSVHSKKMRPGKVKGIRERLMGMMQATENNLIEVNFLFILKLN